MSKIAITTECVCDLPIQLMKEMDIGCIYFDILTDKGIFQDTTEISERNVLEYMENGEKKAKSDEPLVVDYMNLFKAKLQEYDEVIHICISEKVSRAITHATMAKLELGEAGDRIFLIDSMQLSSGMGLMALKAAQMRDEGKCAEEIVAAMYDLRKRVSTTFITKNADYLFFNMRVSKLVMKMCQRLNLHPVLRMKDGTLQLKNIMVGNYEKACNKYVSIELAHPVNIEENMAFITHAGCNNNRLEMIKERVNNLKKFEKLWCQPASATITCNCGPDTFGVIFLQKGKV